MGSLNEMLNSDATHTRTQSKIDAARTTQASGNLLRGAQAAAANTERALGNRRNADAAGTQINAITENISRNLDAATSGTFQQRLAAAEEMGSTVANASAAGVGGSTVDLYKATLNLSSGMKDEASQRAVASDQYTANQGRIDTATNAGNAYNDTQANANLDFTQYVDDHKMGGTTKLLAFAAAAGATYFGGPQAGMAVLDATQAQQDARNGDFNAAGAHMDTAFQGAVNGWKNYRSLGDKTHLGQAYGQSAWDSVKSLFK